MNQQTADSDDRLLKKQEAASVLACSVRTIDRLANMGRLSRVKVLGAVRYRWSEIQSIMAQKTS
jgi:predicted DNA-binding transcriptional regulator AlpA